MPVLGFTFLVSLLTGVLFGVAPAWMTANADPAEALRGANRSTAQGASWTQKSLVVLQAALSLVLLCAAGLLMESLRNTHNQHFGFETTNRYLLHIDPQMAGTSRTNSRRCTGNSAKSGRDPRRHGGQLFSLYADGREQLGRNRLCGRPGTAPAG